MYIYVNTTEQLHLDKAGTLMLTMRYFALKIVSYSHAITPSNLINKSSSNNPTQIKSPTRHTSNIETQAPNADVWYYCCSKFAVCMK